MKYSSLFSINIEHSFYANRQSPDFQLVPAPDCRNLLKKHRMLWREKPSSWQVITPLTEVQVPAGVHVEPQLPFETGSRLRFFLKLANPKVIQFTHFHQDLEVNSVFKGHTFLRFFNANGMVLAPQTIAHYEKNVFKVLYPSQEAYFFLQYPPLPDLSASDFTISGLPVQHPDKYFEAEKKLVIDTRDQAPGAPFTVTFKAIPPWARGVFGIVDIEIFDPKKMGTRYLISLDPRTVHWYYYVISDKNKDQLSIKDEEEGSGAIVFKQEVIPEGDPVAKWLGNKFPDAQTIVLFKSGSPIAYDEQRSKNIQLVDVEIPQDEKVLIDRLPVPSRENPEVQIVNHYL